MLAMAMAADSQGLVVAAVVDGRTQGVPHDGCGGKMSTNADQLPWRLMQVSRGRLPVPGMD